ncbi:TraX family protein [Proteiniborus sp. DW1]|uniref:TraX family protein n=1 Tax=Proteiniborus sp. DW1 TaxID=1889883 RepID=UPI00092DF886|nr:TraX family protein [Proteiniborus sp. DW1]SCG84194.1 TraX family protein [Proteiniborus sp. DW1]
MKIKIFNGFQLKMIMTILMLLDHIGQFIPDTPIWFRYLGRIVAPIFFFMLVEGFIHTSNRWNYMKRLFTWGFIMFGGSWLLELILPYEKSIPNNIFFSLGTCFALLYMIDLIKNAEDRKVKSKLTIYAIGIGFLALFTEASFLGIGMALIFYFFRDNKLLLSISYIALSSIFILGDFSYENLFLINYQWMMVFSLPFILLYNGEKGRSLKYFFYGFYPSHIWILYIVGYFLRK